jgi:succinoglycan biosynthesis protein ExoA
MPRNILVVIPTLNEARNIEGVVATLLADLPKDTTTTLVVADGGSTDGTVELVQAMARQRTDLHLLHNPKRIQSAAINLAARTFGHDADVLIRCDAHAIYPAGFVQSLVASLDASQADSVVVPMDSVGHSCLQRATAWVSDTAVGSGGSAHRGGRRSGFVDHGHHALFRMASFHRVGGYDETFTHNEDAELDCRQRALGSKVYLDAGIRLQYHPRDTFKGIWRQYAGYGRGRSRTARRHPGSMRLRQAAVPIHFLLMVFALLMAARLPILLLWPLLYMGALAAASVLLAWRHRSLCGLLAGPAAFVMHTSWAVGFFTGLATVRERPWRTESAKPLWAVTAVGTPHE